MRSEDSARSSRPSRGASTGLKIAAWASVLFLHIPLALIILYAFSSEDKSYVFPPPGLTTQWFGVAMERQDVWDAMKLSFRIALWATGIAMVLGTLAAAALARSQFFGREAINLLLILPIALPGVITGISLRSAYHAMEIPFSFWTIVIGHATFCVVVVYNNVVARLRRVSPSLLEASMDLGANGFQTFRHVLLPQMGSALLAVRRLIYNDQDRPIQWLHGLYRPDRYEYEMQLSRVGSIDAKVWVSKEISARFS